MLAVIEWLDAYTISRKKQSLPGSIPDRKGEHSTQIVDAFLGTFLIQVDNDLRVSGGLELVTARKQSLTQLRIIVDFAIKDDPNRAVLVGERLGACAQVDDRKPKMAETNRTAKIYAPSIRATMTHDIEHSLNLGSLDSSREIEMELTGDAAHDYSGSGSRTFGFLRGLSSR
jgi:hypothetical protein